MFEKVVIAAGLFLAVYSTPASAVEPATSSKIQTAPQAAPVPPPPVAAQPSPVPYPGPSQPAPAPYYPSENGYPYPPPGYSDPAYQPYVPAWRHAAYESRKRNTGIALLLEFLVPGIGSIYGDHVTGALMTWGVGIAGVVLILDGVDLQHDCYTSYCPSRSPNDAEIGMGILMILGARIYGFIDAYSSTKNYNERLLAQYGLPTWLSMQVGVQPIRSAGSVAYAPTLQLRF